eukprot:5614602-Amphidinium_carterae.5
MSLESQWRPLTTRSEHTTNTQNINCSFTRGDRRTQPYSLTTQKLVQTLSLRTKKEQTTISSKGELRKQSIAQIDYAFLKSDNDKHSTTVLTMCESTTGLGHATIVPYRGINTEAIKAITKFIEETDYKPQSHNREKQSILDSVK